MRRESAVTGAAAEAPAEAEAASVGAAREAVAEAEAVTAGAVADALAEAKDAATSVAREAFGAARRGLGSLLKGFTGVVAKAANAAGMGALAETLESAAEARGVNFDTALLSGGEGAAKGEEGGGRSLSQRFRSGVSRSLSMSRRMRFGDADDADVASGLHFDLTGGEAGRGSRTCAAAAQRGPYLSKAHSTPQATRAPLSWHSHAAILTTARPPRPLVAAQRGSRP